VSWRARYLQPKNRMADRRAKIFSGARAIENRCLNKSPEAPNPLGLPDSAKQDLVLRMRSNLDTLVQILITLRQNTRYKVFQKHYHRYYIQDESSDLNLNPVRLHKRQVIVKMQDKYV